MDSTLPLLIGAGAGAYLLLRKKKTAAASAAPAPGVLPMSPTPPTASPSDLAPPADEVVDIQGYVFSGFGASPTLLGLSTSVLQQQALASTKCPHLSKEYADLATDIAYEMSSGSGSMTSSLAGQLTYLNGLCAKGQTVGSAASPPPKTVVAAAPGGSMLPLLAVAGIAAYLLFS